MRAALRSVERAALERSERCRELAGDLLAAVAMREHLNAQNGTSASETQKRKTLVKKMLGKHPV